jgi:hypothetical protein
MTLSTEIINYIQDTIENLKKKVIIAFCFGTLNSAYIPLTKRYIMESFCPNEDNPYDILILHFDEKYSDCMTFSSENSECKVIEIFLKLKIPLYYETQKTILKYKEDIITNNTQKMKEYFDRLCTISLPNEYTNSCDFIYKILRNNNKKIEKCIFYNELFFHSRFYSEEEKKWYSHFVSGVYYELMPQIIQLLKIIETEKIIECNNIYLLFINSFNSIQRSIAIPKEYLENLDRYSPYSSRHDTTVVMTGGDEVNFFGLYGYESLINIKKINAGFMGFIEYLSCKNNFIKIEFDRKLRTLRI